MAGSFPHSSAIGAAAGARAISPFSLSNCRLLAAHNEPCQKENGKDPGWVVVREAQLLTLKTVPNTGMAVTIDVGDGENTHPPDKIDVATRLVLWARHLAYGEDITFSGPIYDSFTIAGDKVHIKFKSTGTGLKIGLPPPATRRPVAGATPGGSARAPPTSRRHSATSLYRAERICHRRSRQEICLGQSRHRKRRHRHRVE